MHIAPAVSLAIIGSLTAGCSHLPASGPMSHDIIKEAAFTQVIEKKDARRALIDYAVVDLTNDVVRKIANPPRASTRHAGSRTPPPIRVGVGDVLEVTIFEAGPGGVFSGGAVEVVGGPVKVPRQRVTRSGTISVPYAGSIRVVDRDPREIQRTIEARLKNRAIEPQVVVSVVEQNSSSIAVLGDALAQPTKVKVTGAGERVLDVISQAGGLKHPSYEVFVTLTRGDRRATAHLPYILDHPRANIFVRPGDTLYVSRRQRKFVALGALGLSSQTQGLTGQFAFEQAELSLSEALAKAGGLQDTRADPASVFLYRLEKRWVLERAGIELHSFAAGQSEIPTVYRLNLRSPTSFFAAQRFLMRDKDLIYVANSKSTEFEKFLVYVRTISSTISGVATDAKGTRDVIVGWNVLAF